jgi:ubiquinone/menaquinone biosynthesis C-methylase UbiE
VDDYVKYRPGYPKEMLQYLQESLNITTDKQIADIGSGTGISSAYFLEEGYTVMGIEPNKEMRNKSIDLLDDYIEFTAVNGSAEDTTLREHSVDVIISGQAFHWFDKEKARVEFKRILKEPKTVVLFWNERLMQSAFEIDYDALIVRHATDYVKVDHRFTDLKSIQKFFYPGTCELKEFSNHQLFEYEGLKGRLLSSSYMPQKGQAGYEAMVADLEQLFQHYQQDNAVRINYVTKVYAGDLG